MVLAGTLDRHPQLRIVIGHMGEMLPMMLARIDAVSALDVEHLQRPISRGGGEERALRLVSVQHTNALFALKVQRKVSNRGAELPLPPAISAEL
jgi:hypothetical protein